MLSFNIDQWDFESVINSTSTLQRFMPFNEKSIEALSGPYLWFSLIENFNDPFEDQFEYVFTRDPKDIIDSVEFTGYSGWPSDVYRKMMWHEFQQDPEGFYHKWETIFIKTYEQAASDAKYAYCCFFSEKEGPRTPQEIALMWSHYGNGLRGMRVTYDTKRLIGSMDRPVRATFINYSKTPRKIKLAEEFVGITGPKGPRWSEDLFNEDPSTKSESWKYESEFRIISEIAGSISFDPSSILSVDLGDKMPDSQKRVVSLLMQQVNPNARINIAKVRPRSFDIDYIPH